MNEQQISILIELLENVEKQQKVQGEKLDRILIAQSNIPKTIQGAGPDSTELVRKIDELILDNKQQDSRLHKSIVESFKEIVRVPKSNPSTDSLGSSLLKAGFFISLAVIGVLYYQKSKLIDERNKDVFLAKKEVVKSIYESRESNKKQALRNYDTAIYSIILNEDKQR